MHEDPQRGEDAVAEGNVTIVPADFFERLLRAFDARPPGNPPLRRAVAALPNVVDER